MHIRVFGIVQFPKPGTAGSGSVGARAPRPSEPAVPGLDAGRAGAMCHRSTKSAHAIDTALISARGVTSAWDSGYEPPPAGRGRTKPHNRPFMEELRVSSDEEPPPKRLRLSREGGCRVSSDECRVTSFECRGRSGECGVSRGATVPVAEASGTLAPHECRVSSVGCRVAVSRRREMGRKKRQLHRLKEVST